VPNKVLHRTSAGCAHTFGILAPTADSASGGFVRQFPPLPVTPAVGFTKAAELDPLQFCPE